MRWCFIQSGNKFSEFNATASSSPSLTKKYSLLFCDRHEYARLYSQIMLVSDTKPLQKWWQALPSESHCKSKFLNFHADSNLNKHTRTWSTKKDARWIDMMEKLQTKQNDDNFYQKIQWSLLKADTLKTNIFVRFRQLSTLDRLGLWNFDQ